MLVADCGCYVGGLMLDFLWLSAASLPDAWFYLGCFLLQYLVDYLLLVCLAYDEISVMFDG